jgi:hypothetical protein
MDFILRDREGNEVKIGDKIIGSDLREYKFKGFSRGRIGPKMVVHDVEKNYTRELFTSVFPAYMVEEKIS